MKRIFSKKVLLILIILALIGAGAGAGYFFIIRNSGGNSINTEPTEVKVDTVFGYIDSESTYSRFNTLVGMFESEKYLTNNEAGLSPSLIIFAPNNDAFDKDDAKLLDSINANGREQIKLYHIAKIYPLSETETSNLELADGQKIVTLSGRELLISKNQTNFVVTDAKGREANVAKRYASSTKGDRIYFIDQVLLFQ